VDKGLKILCPHCGARIKVRDTLIGKTVRCPACRREFGVALEDDSGRSGTASQTGVDATVAGSEQPRAGAGDANAATIVQSTEAGNLTPSLGHLGRFKLQAVLGQGGCGRVYRAYDPQLDRTIALKVPVFVDDDGSLAQRFQTEARAAAQLRHPHIVPTFDSGQAGSQFYIASQFIDGKPLSAHIREGAVPADRAVEWTIAVARALGYAHGMGIVHRDIKPHNVMLDERGEPQLMDFGLAKRVDEQSDLTTEGSVIGTPAYMAPEQAGGEWSRVGPRSDQYSLGATLYELLSGRKPFEGPPLAVLTQLARQEPPALRSLVPELHPDLEAICQKAMRKEPDGRYPDCDAFADDLERWRRGEPTLARPVTRLERLQRWTRRNRGLATALGMAASALLAAAGIGTWFAVYQARAAADLRAEQSKTLDALRDTKQAKELAEKHRVLAEEGQALANAKSEESRARQYAAEMLVAESAWSANRTARVREMLRKQEPSDGVDLRGWEWHFQDRLCNVEQAVHHQPGWKSYFAFDHGGTRIALVGAGNTVQLLPTADLKAPPVMLEGLGNSVWDMAFHPSKNRLVTTSRVPEIVYWDLDSRQPLWRMNPRMHTAEGNRVVFSRDGRFFVVGAQDGALLVEATDERPPEPKHFPSGTFARGAVISSDGVWLASGSDQGTVRLWNTDRNSDDRVSFAGVVRDLKFDAEGGRLLVAAAREVALADVKTKAVLWKHPAPGLESFRAVSFFRSESLVVAGDSQGALTVLDAASGEVVRTIRGHEISVEDVDVKGDEIWSLDSGGTLRIWRDHPRPGERVLATVGHPIGQILVDPTGQWFAALHESHGAVPASSINANAPQRAVSIRSFVDGSVRGQLTRVGDEIHHGDVSRDGLRMLLALRNGKVEVWDVSSRTRVLEVIAGTETWNAGHKRVGVQAALFDAAGSTFFTVGVDGKLKKWNASDGRLIGELNYESGGELPVDGAIAGHARQGAVGYKDRIEIWDLDTGTVLRRFPVSTTRLAFSSDGRWLVATLPGGSHTVLDARSGAKVFEARMHVGNVIDSAFSHDGLRVFTSGSDRAFRVWDVRTGQEVRTLPGLRFAPLADGGRFVVGDSDGTIRLFDGNPRSTTGD
jgi:predicted Zn finger-like uncharacterized protein